MKKINLRQMLEVTIYSCFSTITRHDDGTIVLEEDGIKELCTQIIDTVSKVAVMSPVVLNMEYAEILALAKSRGINIEKDYLPYTQAILELAQAREKNDSIS